MGELDSYTGEDGFMGEYQIVSDTPVDIDLAIARIVFGPNSEAAGLIESIVAPEGRRRNMQPPEPTDNAEL